MVQWSSSMKSKERHDGGKQKSVAKIVRESKGAGSRRIFSPLFKLQVLDSYRQDADCQGNQRATARKYGIHRRQIQKWLQMEATLRLSVQQSSTVAAAAATSSSVVTSTSASTTNAALNLSPSRQSDASSGDGADRGLTFHTLCLSCPQKQQDTVPDIGDSKGGLLTVRALCLSCSLKPKQEQPQDTTTDIGDGKEVCNSEDGDEYVNVDEITDSEVEDDETVEEDELDDETSSSCSSSQHEKALDFTRATLSKRRFYSTEFKVHVLDAFRNDRTCQGNQRATARKFGIHRRQVQKWLNQEHLLLVKSEADSSSSSCCLDLSSSCKRKLQEEADEFVAAKRCRSADDAQESALCLVKGTKMEPFENNNNIYDNHSDYHRTSYPSASAEYSYFSHSNLAASPEYPSFVYQPWYSYQPISRVIHRTDSPGPYDCMPKCSYSLNWKYETSYVDIPLQYGFGDSVPSKWIKENPLYLREPPAIRCLGSYR